MEKHINQSSDKKVLEVHTSQMDFVEINIQADSLEEILTIISNEFEKHPPLHHFSGRFVGFARGVPTVSFETEKEPRCASPQ
jgi:hypothetical protein